MSLLKTKTSILSHVFGYMFIGLLFSAISAYVFAENNSLMSLLVTLNSHGKQSLSIFGILVIIMPLALVLIMSFGYDRLNKQSLLLLFLLFSVIDGISFSFIIIAYTKASLISCFITSAFMFGITALYGVLTKRDLSSIGNILFMALIGIIVSLFINMLLHSQMLDYIISIIGVVVFSGLTAYDVQKLNNIYDDEKGAILGALSLYLDFVNMFLFMLRLFGNNKD